ncbi:MAG: cyclic nucleotide-binding domain-containing protein [Deltaproteobacteria bacterium]|nr:MAG: cyclic nucleotide-binding domain-containing protein [Deltaproteobacteria bacterium]
MISSEIFRHYPFFASLTEEQIEAVAAICEEKSFPKDSILFKENNTANELMLLLEGAVELFYSSGDGTNTTVCSIAPGAIFGVSSLIAPYKYTSSALATTPIKVVDIDGAALREMAENDEALSHALMSNVAASVLARLH